MTKQPQNVYIIPPYLLHSTFGSVLQRSLARCNPDLADSNVVATDSKLYAPSAPKPPPTNKFSSDPVVHRLIKEKLLYKLSIIGVLGTNPRSIDSFSDEEAFELFQIFEAKLMDSSDTPSTDLDKSKQPKNVFQSDILGEVELPIPDDPAIFEPYHLNHRLSLKKLLSISKAQGMISSELQGFLRLDSPETNENGENGPFFEFPLPCSWVPIIPNSKLTALNQAVDITAQLDDGLPVLDIVTKEHGELQGASSFRYINFITDREVKPNTGIYYYEAQIEQEYTSATKLQPLLASLSSSLSSKNSPQFCIGIVKRRIEYESTNQATNGSTHHFMDLNSVMQDLKYSRDKTKSSNMSIDTLLDAKPGELKGSFALDLSDSNFYNSIKGSESAHRTTLLSMSRRLSALSRQHLEELDPGRVDTEVKFSSKKIVDEPDKVITQSDVVGFGINFYTKNIFITLNGVLITTISHEELSSTNSPSADLFTDSNPQQASVYPMVGFKFNDVSFPDKGTHEPSKLRIKTNLGFKQFKFNINNYVKSCKENNNKALDLRLLKQIQEVKQQDSPNSIEKQLLNVEDNSSLLNQIIKGYLYTEGYIDTFNALNRDLEPLQGEASVTDDVISKSHGRERQQIKVFFMNDKFDEILQVLEKNYIQFFSDTKGQDLLFHIKLQKLVFLLKTYIERLTKDAEEFSFDHNSMAQLYNEALELATQLINDPQLDSSKKSHVKLVSSVFLVKDKQGYKNVPSAAAVFEQYDRKVVELCDLVNKRILKGLKFHGTSNLEAVIDAVDKNIKELAMSENDSSLGLVNFEKDYLSL